MAGRSIASLGTKLNPITIVTKVHTTPIVYGTKRRFSHLKAVHFCANDSYYLVYSGETLCAVRS